VEAAERVGESRGAEREGGALPLVEPLHHIKVLAHLTPCLTRLEPPAPAARVNGRRRLNPFPLTSAPARRPTRHTCCASPSRQTRGGPRPAPRASAQDGRGRGQRRAQGLGGSKGRKDLASKRHAQSGQGLGGSKGRKDLASKRRAQSGQGLGGSKGRKDLASKRHAQSDTHKAGLGGGVRQRTRRGDAGGSRRGGGRMLATTSADQTVKLWSIPAFAHRQTLTGHQRWVRRPRAAPRPLRLRRRGLRVAPQVWDAQFSSDSNTLATGSSDNTGRLGRRLCPPAAPPPPARGARLAATRARQSARLSSDLLRSWNVAHGDTVCIFNVAPAPAPVPSPLRSRSAQRWSRSAQMWSRERRATTRR
jgi:hypothetical protein